MRDAPAGDRDAELDRQICDVEANLSKIVDELRNVERAIKEGGEARRLVRMLEELEGQWEEARDALRTLEGSRMIISGQTVQARIVRLLGTLEQQEGDPLDVAAVNATLLSVFRRVTIDYSGGVLDFEWQHGGSVELPYALP